MVEPTKLLEDLGVAGVILDDTFVRFASADVLHVKSGLSIQSSLKRTRE